MLARAHSFAIEGVEARRVCVELDIRSGLPAFNIVGLGAGARQARERVLGAIANSGFAFPRARVTANLAPGYLEKSGPSFDLALACAVLAASGQTPGDLLDRVALFAELSLGGELRPCVGALAAAEGAHRAGLRGLVVAPANAREAAQVDGLPVAGPRTLREVGRLLDGRRDVLRPRLSRAGAASRGGAEARGRGDPSAARASPAVAARGELGDLADVRGQRRATFALTVAAAGGHHLLLSGSPGAGKTMLARRLPSILPPLSRAEAVEVTKIHSLARIHPGGDLISARPFRAPHHTISPVGLVGGGPLALPGEAVLAHHGVLFLDELSEFSRAALDALRQPLEDGRVAIVRRQQTAVYPTRFMLVAATNPCPCGYRDEGRRCRCRDADMARHRRKLSGPLLDRIELFVRVRRPTSAELRGPPQTTSARALAQVADARGRQAQRLRGSGARCNAELDLGLLRARGGIDAGAEEALRRAYETTAISARGHVRVMRVARTIADLDGSDRVRRGHVVRALELHPEGVLALRRTG